MCFSISDEVVGGGGGSCEKNGGLHNTPPNPTIPLTTKNERTLNTVSGSMFVFKVTPFKFINLKYIKYACSMISLACLRYNPKLFIFSVAVVNNFVG